MSSILDCVDFYFQEPSNQEDLSSSGDTIDVYSNDDQVESYDKQEGIFNSSVALYVFIFFSGISVGALVMRRYSDLTEIKNVARLRRPEL
jgi:hypothetical protein